MLETPAMLSPRPSSLPALGAAEREVIEFFVQLGKYLALPRSVGAIYGMLFATGGRHTLDDLVVRLAISKGSASQGLRMLRDVGAVRVSHEAGDRKDYFEAEADVSQLIRGFVREQLGVRLERGERRLGRLHQVVADPRSGAPDGLVSRVERLQAWHDKARRLVPLVSTFLKI